MKLAMGYVNEDEADVVLEHKKDIFDNRKGQVVEKLDLIEYEYQQQYSSIENRMDNYRQKFFICIAFFGLANIVEIYFLFLLTGVAGGLLAQTFEMWIAVITIEVVLCKVTYELVKSGINYYIHAEKSIFTKHIVQKHIFTLKEERRYCEKMIREVKLLKQEVIRLEYDNVDMLGRDENLDIDDVFRKYETIQYEEKRADRRVALFFEDNQVWFYVIMIIIEFIKILI